LAQYWYTDDAKGIASSIESFAQQLLDKCEELERSNKELEVEISSLQANVERLQRACYDLEDQVKTLEDK